MKNALIIWGGWDGHQPRQCAEFFAPLIQAQGFSVDVRDSLEILEDREYLAGLSLIVPMWTCGVLTPEREKNLCDAILRGVGLGGFHGGMGDAFRGSIGFQWAVGGQFVAHPGNIKDYSVQIVNSDDPITAGFSDFAVRTEQYYMLVDPRNDVLATTTFDGEDAPWVRGVVMPVIWKKMHGAGRVFYSNLGHGVSDFETVPAQLAITLRGLNWAGRGARWWDT